MRREEREGWMMGREGGREGGWEGRVGRDGGDGGDGGVREGWSSLACQTLGKTRVWHARLGMEG